MSVTVEDLRNETGAAPSQDHLLTRSLAAARHLVDKYIEEYAVLAPGKTLAETIPETVIDESYLACAKDLWTRRNSPGGIVNQQYDAGMGQVSAPVRISRDPAASFRYFLADWCLEVSVG